jgi:archaemetzincin
MALLKSKIVVVPLGEVDFMLVNRLAAEIGPVFGRSVDILKGMKMPDEAQNVVRGQHYAAVVLAKLERLKANNREKVIGVCEEDLYLPDENFVLGYADLLANSAIVSLFRIRQEFYGLPEDDGKVYPRLYKEALHHLAHLFELPECRNSRCVNYYSRRMQDIDSKSRRFCDICRRKLAQTT